jgi:hypothetical protein
MPTTKLSIDQRKQLLATGVSNTDIQLYADEGYPFAEILDLCETARASKQRERDAEAEAQAKAAAAQRASEVPNLKHHGISHYNPAGGELPKFHVKEFFWIGDPLHLSTTLAAAEIEKLNQLRPGEYVITKTDNSTRIVKITGRRDPATQQWERIEVAFPVVGHEKHGWPTMIQICDQVLTQAATTPQLSVTVP